MCGLTCAIALQREGVDVDVYEAAVECGSYVAHLCKIDLSSGQAKFGEIGAGIGLGKS